ncbi:MAG: transcriptional repressor [Actinomycetota bacterium]|nr:transcriptional repressor [Actinomycetota bacterium]
MHGVAELTESLRATGRKVTAQRLCVFRVLEGDTSHPTAEAVYSAARREMETISLKTVYQTLHELAEMGEVAALDLGTGTLRFDPNVDVPHHHLVCRSCGNVRDLDVAVADVPEVPRLVDGYEVDRAELVLRGLCPQCRGIVAHGTATTSRSAGTIDHERRQSRQHREKGTTCQS